VYIPIRFRFDSALVRYIKIIINNRRLKGTNCTVREEQVRYVVHIMYLYVIRYVIHIMYL